jgi:thymidylate kinase
MEQISDKSNRPHPSLSLVPQMSPAFALQCLSTLCSADLLTLLNDFLLRVTDGPMVLLRPLPMDFDFRRDDVDLLLTELQRTELLQTIFNATAAGQLHMRVRQASEEKVQICLWNLSCTSSLTVDLWSAFTQLPNHPRRVIRADCLLTIAVAETAGLRLGRMSLDSPLSATIRMPADIDLCLLILHLVSKKKQLTSPVVRHRLLLAFDRLRRVSLDETDSLPFLSEISLLLNSAEPLLDSVSIPSQLVRDVEAHLLKRIQSFSDETCEPIPKHRGRRVYPAKTRRWLMKRVPCLAVVGSDGAGKSSVCRSLAESSQIDFEPCVGKKLYRRSLMYQLLSGLAKRIVGIGRGDFDDLMAGWIALRASLSLWNHFVYRPAVGTDFASQEAGAFGRAADEAFPLHQKPHCRTTLLLDRSVASFLIVDRKTSDPQLLRSATWLERLIPPVTTLLLVVPFRQLAKRKQEMSSQGHERYQQLLFEQAMRQKPVDVIVVANTQSVGDAARVIRRICSESYEPAGTGPTEEAAA